MTMQPKRTVDILPTRAETVIGCINENSIIRQLLITIRETPMTVTFPMSVRTVYAPMTSFAIAMNWKGRCELFFASPSIPELPQ